MTPVKAAKAAVLLCACFLQGCTSFGLATSGISVATPKHGWFDVNAKLTEPDRILRPAVPFNLSLHTRFLIQGLDLDREGVLEESVEWFYKKELTALILKLFEKNGIALINDRGLDGSVYVEIADTMEEFGMRYLPFVSTVRWTERKIGKMRITFINSSDKKVTSGLQEENVFVQTGLISDSPEAPYKQKAFEISRVDFTFKGEFVGLDVLDEQLFYRCMEKIQQKVSLEEFFGTPEDVPHESFAPDPADGWQNNTGGESASDVAQ